MIFINIGSNLNSIHGSRFENLSKAINLIIFEKITINKISSIYETPSYPNKENPKFLNICVEIATIKKPLALLKCLKKIEKKLFRENSLRNQPRTCDIDLIDFNEKVIKSKILSLPHPRAHLRNFVLYPLKEINPNWKHPLLNKKIDFLIKSLNHKLRNEITRL
jgi:2-amino-4-hydroxy-6-hydroxymethyldihydropteridine diphosphokinase